MTLAKTLVVAHY